MAEIKVTRSSDKKVNDTKKKVEKKAEDGFKELNKSLTEQAKSLDAQTKLLTEQAKSMKALLSAIKDLKKKKAPETSTKSKASFKRDMNKIKVDIENTRLAKANIMVEHSSIMLQKAALGLEAYAEKVAYDRKLRQEAEEERYRDSYKKSMPFRAARAVSEEKGGFAKSTLISMMTGGLLNPAVVNALGIDKLLFSPITALTRKMFRSKGDENDNNNSSGNSEGNSGNGLLGKFFGKKSLSSDERTSSAVAQSKSDPVLRRLDTIINLLDKKSEAKQKPEEKKDSLLAKLWEILKNIGIIAWNFAKNGLGNLWNTAKNIGSFALGLALPKMKKAATALIGAAKSIPNLIKNTPKLLSGTAKAAKGLLKGALGKLGIAGLALDAISVGHDIYKAGGINAYGEQQKRTVQQKSALENALGVVNIFEPENIMANLEELFTKGIYKVMGEKRPVSKMPTTQSNAVKGIKEFGTATPPKNIDPEYIKAVQKVSNEYGIDPAFMLSQIKAESNFNKNAVSYDRNGRRLAYGSTQFIDSTWNQYGKGLDRSSIEGQVTAQGRYLNDLLKQFGGDYRKAAAAYNAGPERVKTWERRAEMNGTAWEDELQASAWGGDRVHGFQQTINYLDNIERNKYAMNSLLREQGIENKHRIETVDLPSSDTIYAAKNMQSNTDLANRIEENIINNNVNSTPVIYQNNITTPAPKSVYACGDVAKTLIMGA